MSRLVHSSVGIVLVLGAFVVSSFGQEKARAVAAEVKGKSEQDSPAHANELSVLKKQVIEGIKSNYAALKTVVATIERRLTDPSVSERTEERFENEGFVAVMVREPVSVRSNIVTLRGRDLRSDPLDNDGTLWTCVDDVWTQYSATHETAWIRKTGQMPGMSPIDPREVGSTELREPLLDRLRDSELRSFERTEDGIEILWIRPSGKQYRCRVDPQRNYLPTMFEYLDDEGKPYLIIDIEYQRVGEHVWFLDRAQTRYLISGQVSETRTLGRPRVNEEIPDHIFEIKLPVGTRVSDSVHHSIHRVRSEPAPDEDARTKIGDAVPQFKLAALDGAEYSSKQLRGRPYMICFFATWCGPCLAELRQIEDDLVKRVKPDDLPILAIGRGHTAEELQGFVEERKPGYKVIADPEAELFSRFAAKRIPRTYLVGPDGTILFQSVGYDYPKYERLAEAVAKALE